MTNNNIRSCTRCSGKIGIVFGVRNILELNGNAMVPFSFVILMIILSIYCVITWDSSFREIIPQSVTNPGAIRSIRLAGHIAIMILMRWSMSLVPIRALMCRECGATIHYGLGRKWPLAWLAQCSPMVECPRCGYSRNGLTHDACPECGLSYPEHWRGHDGTEDSQ